MASGEKTHIFLVGATGRTGRQILLKSVKTGYSVTALARTPQNLEEILDRELSESERLKVSIVKGSPTSQEDLKSALDNTISTSAGKKITIVSTLGQTRASGNPWSAITSPPMLMTEAAKSLFAAISTLPTASKQQIQKLVIMSMFGVNESFKNLHFLIRPVMSHSNMLQTLEDHNALDEVVRQQKEVPYVMVRPTMLKEGKELPVKVRGTDGAGEGWMPSSITTGSVVSFMLDGVASGEWDGKTPVIVN